MVLESGSRMKDFLDDQVRMSLWWMLRFVCGGIILNTLVPFLVYICVTRNGVSEQLVYKSEISLLFLGKTSSVGERPNMCMTLT